MQVAGRINWTKADLADMYLTGRVPSRGPPVRSIRTPDAPRRRTGRSTASLPERADSTIPRVFANVARESFGPGGQVRRRTSLSANDLAPGGRLFS